MVIRIEVPDAATGGALVRALVGVFDGEGLSLDADRLEVRVDRRGNHDDPLVQTLEAVEAWLADSNVEAARVHRGERSYVITSPVGGPFVPRAVDGFDRAKGA